MGKWYQVAVVSTCPCYMKRKSSNPEMVPVVLQRVGSELNFTKTATIFRSDCSSRWTRFRTWNGPWTELCLIREQERHVQADDLALQPDPHAGPVLPPCFKYVSAFPVGSKISPVKAKVPSRRVWSGRRFFRGWYQLRGVRSDASAEQGPAVRTEQHQHASLQWALVLIGEEGPPFHVWGPRPWIVKWVFCVCPTGRTMDVTSARLDDFKQLVEERGISGDSIIVNQNNGREQKNGRREQVHLGSGLIVFRSHRRWMCSRRSRRTKRTINVSPLLWQTWYRTEFDFS